MTKVGIFFGGPSTEHEISILSAKNVISNLDYNKYCILPIGVDKQGHFFCGKDKVVANLPTAAKMLGNKDIKFSEEIPEQIDEHLSQYIDVAFPVFHGYLGEDGAIQGMFKAFNVPFVGPDVFSSGACMDKVVTKKLLQFEGILVADYIVLNRPETISYAEASAKLGNTMFIKPANSGSSVGIFKVSDEQSFNEAIESAYKYDRKLLIEKSIPGQEIEYSVIGNENPIASDVAGEIVVKGGFYSYEAKYLDAEAAQLKIPAQISEDLNKQAREVAIKAYKALCCEGMARIDMRIDENSRIIINEINTIPGFTQISMYPMLLKHSGMTYTQIISTLIKLAIARHKRDESLIKSI